MRRGMPSKLPDDIVTTTSPGCARAQHAVEDGGHARREDDAHTRTLEPRAQLAGVEPLVVAQATGVEDRREVDDVGAGERALVAVEQEAAAAGERPRLEHRDQPPAGKPLPQRRERRRDLGGVMGEVVDHGDPGRVADALEAAVHAAKRSERVAYRGDRQAVAPRQPSTPRARCGRCAGRGRRARARPRPLGRRARGSAVPCGLAIGCSIGRTGHSAPSP